MKLSDVLVAAGAGGAVWWLWSRSRRAGEGMLPASQAPRPLTAEERDRRYGPLVGRVVPDPSPDNPAMMPDGFPTEATAPAMALGSVSVNQR